MITAKDLKNPNEAVDWRDKGAVNKVQNQGSCGSCWAFAATATVEASHFIKSAKLIKLSEQQLVDCADNCQGCNSGWWDDAYDYL